MTPALKPTAQADIVDMVIGEYIGSGVDRHVFHHRANSDYVVKVSHGEYDFQNIAEWLMWNEAPDHLSEWLAPCVSISRGGLVLIQMKCEPCPKHLLPAKLPRVLGDIHMKNVGIFEGRPVVMDYGRPYALAMAANAKAMRTINYERGTT